MAPILLEGATLARERLQDVRRMYEIGQATQLELKRAEVDLLERELELKRLREALDALGRVKR